MVSCDTISDPDSSSPTFDNPTGCPRVDSWGWAEAVPTRKTHRRTERKTVTHDASMGLVYLPTFTIRIYKNQLDIGTSTLRGVPLRN